MNERMKNGTLGAASKAAPLSLLVTTAGSLYMLHLLMRTANASVARRALEEFRTGLRHRVTPLVARLLGATSVIDPRVIAETEGAATAVEAALGACRSRSPKDLSVWIETRVRAYIDGDPSTPMTPVAAPRVDGFDTLGLISAPRAERAAVLLAVLSRLSSEDRKALEMRMRPGSTWWQVAKALRCSEATARVRYERALERAQLLVVDVLSERANGDSSDLEDLGQAA